MSSCSHNEPHGHHKHRDHAGNLNGTAAVICALIQTAKLNNVGPQAWLADVLARIAGHPGSRLDDLLPRNWKRNREALAA